MKHFEQIQEYFESASQKLVKKVLKFGRNSSLNDQILHIIL